MIVSLTSVAEEEFAKAAEYYELQREGLGDDFVSEILRAGDILQDFPQIGTPIDQNFRVFQVRRFPYSLVYREEVDELVVVAGWHTTVDTPIIGVTGSSNSPAVPPHRVILEAVITQNGRRKRD